MIRFDQLGMMEAHYRGSSVENYAEKQTLYTSVGSSRVMAPFPSLYTHKTCAHLCQ